MVVANGDVYTQALRCVKVNPTERLKSGAYGRNLDGPSLGAPRFSPYRALHPDNLITTIHIDHLAGDGGGSIAR